jgi:hypothetical protein
MLASKIRHVAKVVKTFGKVGLTQRRHVIAIKAETSNEQAARRVIVS